MDDPGRMGLHHWAGFDSSHLKDCLKDHPAMKLMDMVAERDAAFAERDTAKAEKKTAFAERDAALLQRDVAYADRNAAWMERDAALTALSMVRAGKDNNEAAAKLMQMVNLGGAPVPIMDSNLQGVPKAINCLGKAQVKEATPKKQKSTAATGQNNKESKPPSKRSRKQKASVDAVNGVEKLREDGGLNKVSDALVTFFPSITSIPHCSCTGTNQQCYRWGKGGWQSACCTNFLSMYPLPMNPSKRSSRVPGRKMSGGAFKKLLERLLSEGVDISASVDLKTFWAKHGTNSFSGKGDVSSLQTQCSGVRTQPTAILPGLAGGRVMPPPQKLAMLL